jgi:hypothetical protein
LNKSEASIDGCHHKKSIVHPKPSNLFVIGTKHPFDPIKKAFGKGWFGVCGTEPKFWAT